MAEFAGTFCFFLVAVGANITHALLVMRGGEGLGLTGIALATGLALAALITAFGHVSGAHFNPAVTVAAIVLRQVSVTLGAFYVAIQLAAAVLAGFTLRALFPAAAWQEVNLGTTAVAADISFGTAVLVEALLTFMLVSVIFGSAIGAKVPGAAGFAIGFTVAAAILLGGPLTGASMNPARTFGPALAANSWDNHVVYWIGPMSGAILAALVYGLFMQEKKPN